jgi:hypothetical protein
MRQLSLLPNQENLFNVLDLNVEFDAKSLSDLGFLYQSPQKPHSKPHKKRMQRSPAHAVSTLYRHPNRSVDENRTPTSNRP